MRNLILPAILIVLLPLSANAQQLEQIAPLLPSGSKIDLDKAILAFRSQEFERCVELLETARKTHPNLPPGRLMLARLQLGTNVTAAKQQMERAAGENVADPEIFFAFGLIALAEGRATDAQVHFEKASKLKSPTAWSAEQTKKLKSETTLGLGMIAENRSRWQEAESLFAELMKLAPTTSTRQRLARAKFQQGKIEEAKKDLSAAAAADSKLPPPDVSLAALYASTGNAKKAREVLEAGAKANPKQSRYARELAAVHMSQGNDEAAEAMAKRAIQLGDKSTQVKMTLSMISRRMRKYEQAIGMLESVRRAAPTDFEAANQLALTMLESGTASGKQQAVRLAESNVRLYPNSGEALSTLGWVYFQTGRVQDGERYLRAAASQRNVRTETAYFMARVLTRLGKLADAEAAKTALRKMMKQPGLFVLRPEAEKWLADNPSPIGPAP